MSPGASAPRLRTWVVTRGLRRRARRRRGSGGRGDSLAEQDADRRGHGYQRRHAPGSSLEAAAGRPRGYLLRGGHAVVPRTAGRIRRTSRRDEGLTDARLASHAAKAAVPGGSRGSSCTPAGRRHALLGDLDCALGRRRCRGRSVPGRRWSAVRQPGADVFQPIVYSVSAATTVRPRLRSTRRGTGGPAQIMRIERRRITRSGTTLARTTKSPRRAATGPAREATMTQQPVTVLVPERLRLAGDHSHRSQSGPRPPRGAVPRAGPVPVAIGPRPSPASAPSPAAPPARACDANPLAGFWF
jgi:hypothetical protein